MALFTWQEMCLSDRFSWVTDTLLLAGEYAVVGKNQTTRAPFELVGKMPGGDWRWYAERTHSFDTDVRLSATGTAPTKQKAKERAEEALRHFLLFRGFSYE